LPVGVVLNGAEVSKRSWHDAIRSPPQLLIGGAGKSIQRAL